MGHITPDDPAHNHARVRSPSPWATARKCRDCALTSVGASVRYRSDAAIRDTRAIPSGFEVPRQPVEPESEQHVASGPTISAGVRIRWIDGCCHHGQVGGRSGRWLVDSVADVQAVRRSPRRTSGLRTPWHLGPSACVRPGRLRPVRHGLVAGRRVLGRLDRTHLADPTGSGTFARGLGTLAETVYNLEQEVARSVMVDEHPNGDPAPDGRAHQREHPRQRDGPTCLRPTQ
jgi:hypothetical protein